MGAEYEAQMTLASKGKFYDNQIPDGIVNVESWDSVLEKKFMSKSIPFSDNLDALIKSCTDIKVSPDDLLLADKVQILYFVRCISLGDSSYEVNFKCSECEKKVTRNIDLLKDLQVDYATEDMVEPFLVHLPIKDVDVEWRMLRGRDEKANRRFVDRIRARGNSDESAGDFHLLASRIISVGGKPIEDIIAATEFVKGLKGKDNLALHNSIKSIKIGINPELEVACNWCQYPNDIVLPPNKSFFRPIGETARLEE